MTRSTRVQIGSAVSPKTGHVCPGLLEQKGQTEKAIAGNTSNVMCAGTFLKILTDLPDPERVLSIKIRPGAEKT
jgi:hypothetical protein